MYNYSYRLSVEAGSEVRGRWREVWAGRRGRGGEEDGWGSLRGTSPALEVCILRPHRSSCTPALRGSGRSRCWRRRGSA